MARIVAFVIAMIWVISGPIYIVIGAVDGDVKEAALGGAFFLLGGLGIARGQGLREISGEAGDFQAAKRKALEHRRHPPGGEDQQPW